MRALRLLNNNGRDQTLEIKRTCPRPPAPNSVVLGSVTRMSPLQAVLSITVVDGVPLPAGEEFTGVIRVQDVRATEKDKVKIADCFRGGDVVRGLVVRPDFITTSLTIINNAKGQTCVLGCLMALASSRGLHQTEPASCGCAFC